VQYKLIPLGEVAGKTRVMEDVFINDAGNDVTPAFIDYLRPLVGAGLPETARLRSPAVAKILRL
jgi:6-phosphofructokinase 1